jgi:uncharacterized protein (TIGR02147 family)
MTPYPTSVFNFVDYRVFLSDYYQWHKENTQGFSHRLMAQTFGFTSPNFLKLVMDAKRNISKEAAAQIAKGLGLKKKEAEYFCYIVFFSQAKTEIDKNYYFGLIASLRSRTNITSIGPDQFAYFREWYYPVVRELVKEKHEPLDYDALSKAMNKKVSAVKIRKAVDFLKKLGLIALDENSSYQLSSSLLNTENELQSYAIRQYHKKVLNCTQWALDETPPEQREVSHLTIKISQQGFGKIKKRIQEFREELLQLVSDDRAADGVYHVNFQFYPIAKDTEGETNHE